MIRKIQFFKDLIGEDFKLSSSRSRKKISIEYDQNRAAVLDVNAQDELTIKRKEHTNLLYQEKDFSEKEFVDFLSSRIKRRENYDQNDTKTFVTKIIKNMLKESQNLSGISNARFDAKTAIDNMIDQIEEKRAKEKFDKLVKNKKIKAEKVFNIFPKEMYLVNWQQDSNFKKHLYKKAGAMNKEELGFAKKLDGLGKNLKWWFRNVENHLTAFSLQGWHRDVFYPDFIAKTESGKYIVLEYKGEHLLGTPDTTYKNELGQEWAKLAGNNYYFFMVVNDNATKSGGEYTVTEVIAKIKALK